MAPTLTFFVELPAAPLADLFRRPGLVELLAARGAAISMAMLDLDPARAEVVRGLNARAVPVTAWLVLEEEAGYWLSADSADPAAGRYHEVREWARRGGLRLEAVGLDIEPPREDALALLRHAGRAAVRLVRRRRGAEALRRARERYAALVEEIRQDGLRVETYQLPVIFDERRARSTLLQRVFGLVDLAVDREVLMLYSTHLPPPLGAAQIDAYGPEAQAIAVGVTGGGAGFLEALPGVKRRLGLDELIVDLRRARRHADHLYVFSLEGCVEAGFLDELCQADLDRRQAPARLAPLGRLARAGLRALLALEGLW